MPPPNHESSAEELLRACGERLQLVRRARGLSQGDLARAVGVSRSAVAQWETGRMGCGTRLDAIASALNVLPRELLPRLASDKVSLTLNLGQASRQEAELMRLFQEIDLDAQGWLIRIMRLLATVPAQPTSTGVGVSHRKRNRAAPTPRGEEPLEQVGHARTRHGHSLRP